MCVCMCVCIYVYSTSVDKIEEQKQPAVLGTQM